MPVERLIMSIEQPVYETLKQDGDFEVRRYNGYILAWVEEKGDTDAALNPFWTQPAFRSLLVKRALLCPVGPAAFSARRGEVGRDGECRRVSGWAHAPAGGLEQEKKDHRNLGKPPSARRPMTSFRVGLGRGPGEKRIEEVMHFAYCSVCANVISGGS
jgi:hypothetical protein